MSKQEEQIAVVDAVVAPEPVVMATAVSGENPLLSNQGFLIRQDRQTIEWFIQDCLGLWCIEYDNIYDYAPLGNQHALRTLNDSHGWRPSQIEIDNVPKTLRTKEESDCVTKCILMTVGAGSCRPFKMNLMKTGGGNESYMHIDREFALGGCLCMPHNAVIYMGGNPVARVIEDWNCGNWICRYCEAAWCCRVPYDIQLIQNNTYANRYRINVNFCACGPHFNFCGSTPFCNDALWDINEYAPNGAVNSNARAGRIQKSYGGCGSIDALLRWCCCHADNFLVEWEDKTTAEERAAMLGATTLIEYVFFEHRASYGLLAVASALGSC